MAADSSDLDFSVEMETGTGKTYVYLRTIAELHLKYGFTKFVIVVPSVAIREGVLSSLGCSRSTSATSTTGSSTTPTSTTAAHLDAGAPVRDGVAPPDHGDQHRLLHQGDERSSTGRPTR